MAQVVLSGPVRRAAMVLLFVIEDVTVGSEWGREVVKGTGEVQEPVELRGAVV